VDVSSKAPFKLRDSSEGFTKKLPKHLSEKLKPVHKRDNCKNHGTAHSFWIEAGDLIYDTVETDTMITYKFGDVKMKVKKHLLKYDENGLLVDDENDTEEDNSAEADFAHEFTINYYQIATYFPELARLKELLKLGALLAILRNIYNGTNKLIANINTTINASSVKNDINKISEEIKYPVYTEANVNSAYQDLLRANGLYDDSRVSYTEISSAKSKIRSQLQEGDTQILNSVTQVLAKGYHANESSIKYNVDSWLKNRYHVDTLASMLAQSAKDFIISEKKKNFKFY